MRLKGWTFPSSNDAANDLPPYSSNKFSRQQSASQHERDAAATDKKRGLTILMQSLKLWFTWKSMLIYSKLVNKKFKKKLKKSNRQWHLVIPQPMGNAAGEKNS